MDRRRLNLAHMHNVATCYTERCPRGAEYITARRPCLQSDSNRRERSRSQEIFGTRHVKDIRPSLLVQLGRYFGGGALANGSAPGDTPSLLALPLDAPRFSLPEYCIIPGTDYPRTGLHSLSPPPHDTVSTAIKYLPTPLPPSPLSLLVQLRS